ncbi:MAG TPA: LysR substrate-binding domain-containing protein [Burkholderiaceae bacterium]|nr:LysR substrate-binding domain-containing protein [Burkholderiaceae bacterium]
MPREFDPVSLRLFVAICEEGHIARAAQREALVPSALSKRLAALEAQVGTALLRRARRGVEPTAAGHALLRQSRELLAAMARMHAELSDFAAGVQGSVRVVASMSALAGQLPEDVAGFIARHPAVRITLDERAGREVLREVREGGADLGLAWDRVDAAGLKTQPYRRDRLGVAMPLDHPLAQREALRFVDLLDFPQVGIVPGGLLDQLLRQQAALLGRDYVPRMQVASLEAGARIVAAGLGLAILPFEAAISRSSASPVGAARMLLRPLAEDWAERRLVIVSREERWLSATARALALHLASRGDGTPP